MNDLTMQRELREALNAGENALHSLYAAKGQLNSARNWGIVDLFGGGMISSFVKHSKMSEAEEYLSQARYNLKIFQRELQDVAIVDTLDLNIGDFLSFADFFF